MNSDRLNDEDGFESESSEATILTNESISESVDENCEVARILDQKFHLPKDLCENRELFKELFSPATWNELSKEERAHLSNFLPEFPERNEAERKVSIQQLFGNKISRFGHTPLDVFHNNLQDGNYRPDIAHYRTRILKAEEREQRIRECERISLLAEKLVVSREKLLRASFPCQPGALPTIPAKIENAPKLTSSIAVLRGSKRYFQELLKIADDASYPLSDDETMPSRMNLCLTKKQIKQFNELGSPGANVERRIVSTMSTKEKNWDHIQESTVSKPKYKQMLKSYKKRKDIEPEHPEMEIDEIKMKDVISRTNLVFNAKKLTSHSIVNKKPYLPDSSRMKQELLLSNKAALNAASALTQHVLARNQNSKFANKNLCKIDVQEKPTKVGSQSETDEEDWIKANIIKIEPHENLSQQQRSNTKFDPKVIKQQVKVKAQYQSPESIVVNRKRSNIEVTPAARVGKKIIIDAGGIMKTSFVNKGGINTQTTVKRTQINPKSSTGSILESSNAMDAVEYENESSPELRHETQNCFLSLIRDIFCSTADHRMKLEELRRRINVWLKNPVACLNTWFKDVDHWGSFLVSGVHFLSGEFLDQPEDFVPYLEFKSHLNIYQWIGAGRDSDPRMLNLNQYWLTRHNEMGVRATNSLKQKTLNKSVISPERNEENYLVQTLSPPNIKCRSDWKVRPATKEELLEFHIQERKRFENPFFPFTYRLHGYESVVGPLRGIHSPLSLVTKARDNNVLIADRPNYITTLILARDSIARLPNGEGTRFDICELIKCSQYLAPNLSENVIQSIVSSALDTIASEADPAVKFDIKKKQWIYVHRNRTEEEFERLHQQQGNMRQKKTIYRKVNAPENSMRIITSVPSNTFKVSPKISKVNISSTNIINKPLPALTSFENKQKIVASSSSPPPLKISPKRFIKAVTNDKNIEPFDVEASLDVHTMPIVKTSDTKTMRVALKSVSQISPARSTSSLSVVNSQMNQSIVINANRSQSPKVAMIGSKKIIGKPVVIGQNQAPPLITQTSTVSSQNYLIPLNMNASINNNSKINKSSEPPALTNSIQGKTSLPQTKNIVKVNSTTGKTVLSPQQAPKFILTASPTQNQKGGKLITLPKSQTPMLSQQKQILTNVIVQQQKAKSSQNIILATSNHQKIPALTISSSSVSTPITRTSSPQIIHIQQPSTTATSGNINPQQRQTIYQLKQVKQDGGQQTMILKPQIVKTVSSSNEIPAPPLVSVSKIFKSGTSTIVSSPQIITTTAQKLSTETTNSPIFARVVSAGSRQLIDGILPKNSTTFKLAGTNSGVQQGLIQIAGTSQYAVVSKGKNIVSVSSPQPKIVTTQVSNISTLASSSNASTTQNIIIASPTSNSSVVTSQHQLSNSPLQQSLKIVQGGSITAQQLLNAKLINVQTLGNKNIKTAGGIKMINTQGYITNIGGKGGGVPIIIAAGKGSTNNASTSSGQGIVLQANATPNGTFILNQPSQTTLKVQGNILTQGNMNVINHPITSQNQQSQQQTVVLGNQVLKVQSLSQLQKSSVGSSKSTSETMVLSTNGGSGKQQTLSNQDGKSLVTSSGGQQIILGSTLKVLKNVIKPNTSQQTARVVLASPATQGGGQFAQQIILPANFQGIKTLQGLKVIQQARLISNNNLTSNSNESKQANKPGSQEETMNE